MDKNEKQDNPMAFPVVGDSHSQNYLQEGMTLRDYFAARALSSFNGFAVMDENGNHFNPNDKNYPDAVAEMCYKIADAMLTQRQ